MSKSLPEIFSIKGEGTLLLFTEIAELHTLVAAANQSDLAAIEGFSSQSRQAERLAWRIMLRQELCSTPEVAYSPSGAPTIIDSQYKHISVSHCADRVMVALSQWPCGVDIERLDRRFTQLAPRYMNNQELMLALSHEAMAAVWCAKECLYKMASQSGLDLRGDILITEIDLNKGTIIGHIKDGQSLTMRIMMPDKDHIAVYFL